VSVAAPVNAPRIGAEARRWSLCRHAVHRRCQTENKTDMQLTQPALTTSRRLCRKKIEPRDAILPEEFALLSPCFPGPGTGVGSFAVLPTYHQRCLWSRWLSDDGIRTRKCRAACHGVGTCGKAKNVRWPSGPASGDLSRVRKGLLCCCDAVPLQRFVASADRQVLPSASGRCPRGRH